MPKRLPIGVDNFAKLIESENNYLFSDKTLFIKELIDDGSEVILITRPRRWGKTLNMSMLQHFFAAEVNAQITQHMFDSFAIAKIDSGRYVREYQGQFPVISISFKDIKENNFADALVKIKLLIQDLFDEYEYLIDSPQLNSANKAMFNRYFQNHPNQAELENALKALSKLLQKHFSKPVYILIDEYDTPLNSAHNYGYLDEMTNFMKNMFSAALKGNPALKKGVLTGILRISKDSMLSGLNNLKVFTVLNERYNQYFGFTNAELDALFSDQGLSKDEERVKAWYNGYRIGNLTLYNPWSILNCLYEKGVLKPYWVNTANDSLLREILQNASVEIKAKFQQLLEGKVINGIISETIRYENIQRNEVSLWSLLLYTGYLTAKSVTVTGTNVLCELAIPNHEVHALYDDIFLSWMEAIPQQDKIKSLLSNLVEGNVDQFASDVSSFLQTAASIHDYAKQPEAFYHGFMLALTAGLLDDYYIDSNRESGLGRPDLLFIPKDTTKTHALILEFKHVPANADPKTIAKQALAQIDRMAYSTKINQYSYIKQVIKIGLAFDGKLVHYEIAT